jgi:hypothetical protein
MTADNSVFLTAYYTLPAFSPSVNAGCRKFRCFVHICALVILLKCAHSSLSITTVKCNALTEGHKLHLFLDTDTEYVAVMSACCPDD